MPADAATRLFIKYDCESPRRILLIIFALNKMGTSIASPTVAKPNSTHVIKQGTAFVQTDCSSQGSWTNQSKYNTRLVLQRGRDQDPYNTVFAMYHESICSSVKREGGNSTATMTRVMPYKLRDVLFIPIFDCRTQTNLQTC
jgi:hypothetical protein